MRLSLVFWNLGCSAKKDLITELKLEICERAWHVLCVLLFSDMANSINCNSCTLINEVSPIRWILWYELSAKQFRKIPAWFALQYTFIMIIIGWIWLHSFYIRVKIYTSKNVYMFFLNVCYAVPFFTVCLMHSHFV